MLKENEWKQNVLPIFSIIASSYNLLRNIYVKVTYFAHFLCVKGNNLDQFSSLRKMCIEFKVGAFHLNELCFSQKTKAIYHKWNVIC